MANAHKIARECGITLHGRGTAHPASPMLPKRHTWSRDAIKRVALQGEQQGRPDHVYDVLSLMVARDSGACMLFGDVIRATSKWMAVNRVSSSEVAFLIEPYAEVDLLGFRQTVVHYRIDARPSQIAMLLSAAMEPALTELRR